MTGWKSLLNNNFVGRKKGAINKTGEGTEMQSKRVEGDDH
jgi:hypothetical protein